MKGSTLAMYDQEKFEDEFKNNYLDCQTKYAALFNDSNEADKNVITVCAPGMRSKFFIYR